MKNKIVTNSNGLTVLSGQELLGIYGGNFFYCEPSDCIFAYAANILMSLVIDNIEHPIGAAGGYPPK